MALTSHAGEVADQVVYRAQSLASIEYVSQLCLFVAVSLCLGRIINVVTWRDVSDRTGVGLGAVGLVRQVLTRSRTERSLPV